MSIKVGDRVRLRSVNGEPEEVATVDLVSETKWGNYLVVQVDSAYLTSDEDDGLRECMEEDVVEVLDSKPLTDVEKFRFGMTEFGDWHQNRS